MNIETIRGKLDARLSLLAPALPTAWQDVQFTPPALGAPFQRTMLIPAPPFTPTLTEQVARDQGIYQIMLSFPAGNGPGAADRRASAIQAHFPAQLDLGDRLRTRGKPIIAPPLPDDARILIPVSVRYEVIQ